MFLQALLCIGTGRMKEKVRVMDMDMQGHGLCSNKSRQLLVSWSMVLHSFQSFIFSE
jgi:hypothetical protein